MEKAIWADKAMFKIHNSLNGLKNYEAQDSGKEYKIQVQADWPIQFRIHLSSLDSRYIS